MFEWFGRKAVEPVRPYVPVWLQSEGEAGGYVRGYEAQLTEVYRRNPVGLRAVRLVAALAGSLPLFADGDPSTGSGQVAVALVRAGGLMERAAANLLLHGNAYVRLAVDGHDRPAELYCLRPERVSVACGADGWGILLCDGLRRHHVVRLSDRGLTILQCVHAGPRLHRLGHQADLDQLQLAQFA